MKTQYLQVQSAWIHCYLLDPRRHVFIYIIISFLPFVRVCHYSCVLRRASWELSSVSLVLWTDWRWTRMSPSSSGWVIFWMVSKHFPTGCKSSESCLAHFLLYEFCVKGKTVCISRDALFTPSHAADLLLIILIEPKTIRLCLYYFQLTRFYKVCKPLPSYLHFRLFFEWSYWQPHFLCIKPFLKFHMLSWYELSLNTGEV